MSELIKDIINTQKADLLSLLPEELEELMLSIGEPKYRASQLFSQMHKGISPQMMTNIGKATKAKLDEVAVFLLNHHVARPASGIYGKIGTAVSENVELFSAEVQTFGKVILERVNIFSLCGRGFACIR